MIAIELDLINDHYLLLGIVSKELGTALLFIIFVFAPFLFFYNLYFNNLIISI